VVGCRRAVVATRLDRLRLDHPCRFPARKRHLETPWHGKVLGLCTQAHRAGPGRRLDRAWRPRQPPAGSVGPVPNPLTRGAPLCLLVAGALALTGCATDSAGGTSAPGATGSATPSATPTCTPAPLAERAAAVLLVGLPGVTTADDPLAAEVVDLGVSGIFLNHDNVVSAQQVEALSAGLRERAGRPFLVATDEESGRVAVTRAIVGAGPSPRRLAAQRTPEQVREFARELGSSLSAIGVDLDLAPLLDLDDGPAGGIVGDRSFSADPLQAAEYGLAFSRGLADADVHPTVKHFPGQGRSTTDTHRESDVVDAALDELRASDLVPFQQAVDAGVPAVMLNHLTYSELDPDLPASLAPAAYALLRETGFEGVAMTDSLGMGSVHLRWDFPVSAVMAIAAGADIALATDGRQATRMRDALVEAVQSGRLPVERLDEAAGRATALAGGDPQALSCSDAVMPVLRDATTASAAPGTPTPPAEPSR
jgi:beta-N-acetylhexosaminidase